jgi:PadR family transcriptional regulator AphA
VSAYFELPPQAAGAFDPMTVIAACIESEERNLLVDDGALPPEFFDLSTGAAGALVQKLTLYEIRMAGVVPDPSIHSQSFQDFAREANKGRWFRFFPSRAQAVEWLASE